MKPKDLNASGMKSYAKQSQEIYDYYDAQETNYSKEQIISKDFSDIIKLKNTNPYGKVKKQKLRKRLGKLKDNCN